MRAVDLSFVDNSTNGKTLKIDQRVLLLAHFQSYYISDDGSIQNLALKSWIANQF